MEKKQMIIEAKTIEEANSIDQTVYRFERYSDTRDCYIFVKRRDK